MARCLALDTQSRASYSHALDSHGDTVCSNSQYLREKMSKGGKSNASTCVTKRLFHSYIYSHKNPLRKNLIVQSAVYNMRMCNARAFM